MFFFRNLTPTKYRLLHLLTHTALLLGSIFDTGVEGSKGKKKGSKSNNNNNNNDLPANFTTSCVSHIKNDISTLHLLLALGVEDTTTFIHVLVNKVIGNAAALPPWSLTTVEARVKWEDSFSNSIHYS